ncbi:hypothetical protein DL766_000679 [Monosporascus sp. MC13-8B]|uniref:DUF5672 domain-containing protein n=1 Tax=Monosporascus cannonballus TaxID=155416 RepID=A0ABY0HC63_9PEZI|nr:hypothetical protein DL762_003870 [Monosporascus cannonballus]RYP38870.1 hypothetical protein DL766_000679 [Monosporascus sp. MC13-8B]
MKSQHESVFSLTRMKVILILCLVTTYREAIKARLEEAGRRIPEVNIDWHPKDTDPRRQYNASKLALLIEPRPMPRLVPQILHMISVVPPDWRFLFIGSNKSVISVGRSYSTKHQQEIGKLDLMVLPEPWEIDSKEKVHRMLTDVRFYDEILPGVEWILKYEYDSILCANSPTSLNEWLHWDWAGAPRVQNDRYSGNGGLSLRRVSTIKRVLRFQSRYNDTQPEDEWFGHRVIVLPGAKVASDENGQLTVEDVYMPNPMGFHVRDGGNQLAEGFFERVTRPDSILHVVVEDGSKFEQLKAYLLKIGYQMARGLTFEKDTSSGITKYEEHVRSGSNVQSAKITLEAMRWLPIEAILRRTPTSCVINFISWNKAFSIFPRLTYRYAQGPVWVKESISGGGTRFRYSLEPAWERLNLIFKRAMLIQLCKLDEPERQRVPGDTGRPPNLVQVPVFEKPEAWDYMDDEVPKWFARLMDNPRLLDSFDFSNMQ